ncbi:hypothetical protein F2P56_000863, partial [Juglans regia]
MEGVAKYVGLSSPAIITTILGSVSITASIVFAAAGLSSFSPEELETRFLYEQTKMINATAISNNIRARLPKRYGIGDFHSRTSDTEDDVLVAGLCISLLSFNFFFSYYFFFSISGWWSKC